MVQTRNEEEMNNLSKNFTRVPGRKTADLLLFALSTCGWCKKTREILDREGVEYDYVYVDNFIGKDGEELDNQVRKWNPRESYPVIVVNNIFSIIGYKEDKILKAIEEGENAKDC